MKVVKIQIFENNRRVEKAVYYGLTIKECLEKMYKEMNIKGVV